MNPNFVHNREAISIQARSLENYTNISVTEAIQLIESTTTLFILDVRTEEEYNAGHINDSVLIPYNLLELRQDELPQNKSRPILVYCRLGGRSVTASNTLISLNYTCVYNMLGGYTAWIEAITSITTETSTIPESTTTEDYKPPTNTTSISEFSGTTGSSLTKTSSETSEPNNVTSTSNLTTGWTILLFLPLIAFGVVLRRAHNKLL